MADELSQAVVKAKQLLKSRNVQGCVKALRSGLEENPNDRDAQELLAMVYFRAGKHEDARDAFRHLTRMDPRYATAWINLGAVLNVLKDFKGASDALRKGIQREKKSATAYYNLAIAQKGLGQPKMAVSAYLESIRSDPTNTDAYRNLGNLYMELCDFPKARKAFADGLERAPENARLKRMLERAEAAIEAGRREDSPFGRLVDEAELAKRQIRMNRRDLSTEERIRERENMRLHAKELRHAVRPIVLLLDGNVPRSLHTIHMAAAQKDSRGEVVAALDQLSQSIVNLDEHFRIISGQITEVRNHLQRTDPGL